MAIGERRLTGVIRWEDPPPPRNEIGPYAAQRAWALVAAELRERPGEWGLIDEASTQPTYAARITRGTSWWAPRGAFEACVRQVDGRWNVYARYVGDSR